MGSRATPRNQSVYASAAPTRPSQVYPAVFATVGTGGRPSAARVSTHSRIPPATSCQAVDARDGTGAGQRFVSVTPAAIDSAPASPATTPTGVEAGTRLEHDQRDPGGAEATRDERAPTQRFVEYP